MYKDHDKKITVKLIEEHSQSISTIAVSQDGQLLLSGSLDNTANLFDLNSIQIIQKFTYHTDTIISVAISPCKKYVLTSAMDNRVCLASVETGKVIHEVNYEDHINSVMFSSCGN